MDILNNENVGMEAEDLKLVINQFYPDLRKILNIIQMSIIEEKVVIDKSILVASNYITQVIKELSKPKPTFNGIRQIIADSGVKDFEELYRALFDHASKYAPNSEGSIAIILNEHLYQANFRIDKEINVMSAIAKILEVK